MTTAREVLARSPLGSPWVRATIDRWWLAVWFALGAIVIVRIALQQPANLFIDARLYVEAAKAWVAGGDPWDVQVSGLYFAGPPPTLLSMLPFALIPTNLGVAILTVAVVGGAVASIRILKLPWWWILFPPLVQCVMSANVQSLLIPLILGGAGGVAVVLKVYAALPLLLLGRWRAVVVAAVACLVTAPWLPWVLFIDRLPEITERLATQTLYALPTIVMVALAPLTIVALAVVGRSNAAWLSVSGLWPSQQFYYGTLTMGTRRRLVGALVALPVPGSALVALGALALVEWQARRRPTSKTYPGPVPVAPGPSAR